MIAVRLTREFHSYQLSVVAFELTRRDGGEVQPEAAESEFKHVHSRATEWIIASRHKQADSFLAGAVNLRLQFLLTLCLNWRIQYPVGDSMAYAILKTGGKQYRVRPGDVIDVDKLQVEPGSSIELGDVLAVSKDDGVVFGSPVVANASVVANVQDQIKDDKITVFKYKRKVRYRVKRGHRQPYTRLAITGIMLDGEDVGIPALADMAVAEETEQPVDEAELVEEPVDEAEESDEEPVEDEASDDETVEDEEIEEDAEEASEEADSDEESGNGS